MYAFCCTDRLRSFSCGDSVAATGFLRRVVEEDRDDDERSIFDVEGADRIVEHSTLRALRNAAAGDEVSTAM